MRFFKPYRPEGIDAIGIERLNPWQEGFCVWNAERLGISFDASIERYRQSWNAIPGGHAGDRFRRFCVLQENVFSVFADDSPEEVYAAYRLHSWLFMLRQISQPVPQWRSDDPVVAALSREPAPVIIDFGCGMAQTSISLALLLKGKGAAPRLFLADIPTVRLDFVTWLCHHLGLSCEAAACTRAKPLPDFPAAQLAVATEIFEHVHDPLPVFDRLHAAIAPGGFLITNVADHEEEFMHVSTDLQPLRDRLAALNYAEVRRNVLFRKP